MELSQRDMENKAEAIFTEHIGGSLLEMHFADLMVPTTPEMEIERRQSATTELLSIFRMLSGERLETLYRYLLKWRSRSDAADCLVNEVSQAMLQSQIISLRSVCEAMLTSADLKIDNEHVWTSTLEFVDKNLNKLDYKGVRDVLKLLFEQISSCPVNFWVHYRNVHRLIENLIDRICDRKNNLLPAYFIVNEIRKLYAEPKCFPHWRVAGCFTQIVESFRQLAQIVTITGRPYILPVSGHFGLHLNTSWKLEPTTLKFYTKGTLPYPNDVSLPQSYLIYQVIMQPCFRELLNVLLSLQSYKSPRCSLEEIFVSIVLELMCEVERDGRQLRHAWTTLGNVFVFLMLNFFVTFPKLVKNLQSKLQTLPYRKARDDLMWFLLQCLSVVVTTKNVPVDDMASVLDLYRTLYKGSEEFSVSESDSSCVFMMAATCVWVLILDRLKELPNDASRAQAKNVDLSIPPSINTQITFLQKSKNKSQLSVDSYMFATFCNAYSTSKETFQVELAPIIYDFLEGGRTSASPTVSPVPMPGGLLADGKCSPLKVEFLDSITVHARMTMMHTLVDIVVKYAQQKTQLCLSPSLVETYARLLSYMDIETIGLAKFISKHINEAFRIGTSERQQFLQQQQQQSTLQQSQSKSGALEVMHLACEIISYRLIQTPTNYRMQILNALHQTAPLFSYNVQFFWMVQSTLARQLCWIPIQDVIQPTFPKVMMQAKDGARLFYADHDELSKLIILSIAKAYVVSSVEGLPDDTYRNLIVQMARVCWPQSTMQFFPAVLAQFYSSSEMMVQPGSTSLASRQPLRAIVEQDYLNVWRSAGSDANLLDHFTRMAAPKTFLCVIWRHILDNGDLPSIAYRILHELGPKNISSQLANLIDYILIDITINNLQKCVECLSKMVWKYAIVPLEWLVLTATLRPYDNTDAFYAILIAFLLLKSDEFLARVQECCNTMSPEFWKHGAETYEKHVNYHQKYPEKYWCNVLTEQFRGFVNTPVLPVYFGNICYAILPALDLLVQRIIEIPEAHDKIFRKLLDTVGHVYKFHPQPIAFLYNTFRFYERRLADKFEMKQKLVYHVHAALAPLRGDHWLLSVDFVKYVQSSSQSGSGGWLPDLDYFGQQLKRVVDGLQPPWAASCGATSPGGAEATSSAAHPPRGSQAVDWRFAEHAAPAAQALYAVCVELMALPCAASDVGASLVDVIVQWSAFSHNHPVMMRKDVNKWLNAVGLVFASLSTNYGEVLYDRLCEALGDAAMDSWLREEETFFRLNFERQWSLSEDSVPCRLMALAHAVWLQASIGYLNILPQKIRDKFRPMVRTEAQFLYVCHLVGPFLQRLHQERSRMAMDVATDLYEMLLNVDKSFPSGCVEWRHEDAVCDLLYHMKYMYVGDGIRHDTDRIIPQLRSASLREKLRFISHQQSETTGSTAGSVPPVQP